MIRAFAGWLAVLVLLGGLFCAVPTGAAEEAKGGLRAGASAVKITPSLTRPVYIAGYANNRVAESVHDDLWARALVLDDGTTRMAVVALDLIGLTNYRVRRIRQRIGARVRSVPPENVLITCTHVHSGPDTLGLWGKNFTTSGVDPLYMERLEDRIVAAVEAAARDVRPAKLSIGTVDVPEGFVHNSREAIQDKELTALRLTDAGGASIASVIHYGGHPEVNKGRALTSDYVHYVREAAEQRFGGVSLYLNGALGGMVTPKVTGYNLPEMERVGRGVGEAAVAALERARPVSVPALRLRRQNVKIPLENDGFRLLLAGKVLDAADETRMQRHVDTEVWRVDLGPMTWITIPGEILPKPALALKAKMPGTHRLVVALGNDELGYILDPDDWTRDLYKYERSMSMGRQTWPLLRDAAEGLLR